MDILFLFQTKDCEVCRLVRESSSRNPPLLPQRKLPNVKVIGEWVSQRCETRPNGVFLTRHLSFLSRRSWEGLFEFYRDPLCSQPHYSIAVKGTYVTTGSSSILTSAFEYMFKTLRMKITLHDFQMVNLMNSYDGNRCGRAGHWKIGVTQDVSDTDGCIILGVELPHVEFELMKTEYEDRHSYLYVGQRPSNFVSLSLAKNRPTSFQNALVKCGTNNDIVDDITPVFEQYSAWSSSDSLIQEFTGSSNGGVA